MGIGRDGSMLPSLFCVRGKCEWSFAVGIAVDFNGFVALMRSFQCDKIIQTTNKDLTEMTI